jgi:hypothetical protein
VLAAGRSFEIDKDRHALPSVLPLGRVERRLGPTELRLVDADFDFNSTAKGSEIGLVERRAKRRALPSSPRDLPLGCLYHQNSLPLLTGTLDWRRTHGKCATTNNGMSLRKPMPPRRYSFGR